MGQDGVPAGPPQQLTTGAGQDVEAAFSPDGKKLAFAILKQNADLWKLPVSQETGRAAGEPQEVVATTREDSRGAWSPDGKWIAFNSDRSGDMNIWLYSLADGSTRQLTKGPGGDFQPTWSPDGRWLVFFLVALGKRRHLEGRGRVGQARPAHEGSLDRHQSVLLARRPADRLPVGPGRPFGGLAHECRRPRGA